MNVHLVPGKKRLLSFSDLLSTLATVNGIQCPQCESVRSQCIIISFDQVLIYFATLEYYTGLRKSYNIPT